MGSKLEMKKVVSVYQVYQSPLREMAYVCLEFLLFLLHCKMFVKKVNMLFKEGPFFILFDSCKLISVYIDMLLSIKIRLACIVLVAIIV